MTQPANPQLDASLASIAAAYAQNQPQQPQAYPPQPQPAQPQMPAYNPETHYLASDFKVYPKQPAPAPAAPPPPQQQAFQPPPAPLAPAPQPLSPGQQIPPAVLPGLVQTQLQQPLPINPPEAVAALGANEQPRERKKRGAGKAAAAQAAIAGASLSVQVPAGARPGSVDLHEFETDDLVTQLVDRGFTVTLTRAGR